MNMFEEHLYNRVKSILFDLLIKDDVFKDDVNHLVYSLKNEMNLQDVTLYFYYKWSDFFIPEASTINSVKKTPTSFFVKKEKVKNECVSLQETCQYSFTLNQKNLQSFIIPLKQENRLVGVLQVDFYESLEIYSQDLLGKIGQDCSLLLKKLQVNSKTFQEDKRYEQLFRVTSKFHSSMNMDDVLEEIIHTLKLVFPSFSYYLLLSHDNNNRHDLPIRILQYDNDSSNMAAIQSYVTGSVQIEDSLAEKRSILYAPLKGRQGVYGVLQVVALSNITFPDDEVNFITLLANTAGSALENAQLYQQSKRLIQDLKLINETSHQLNSDLRLNEVMTFMSTQIVDSFHAREVGFILFESDETAPLPGSTSFFLTDEAKKYINIVMAKILTEKDSLFIGDVIAEYQLKNSKYQSLMAVPMVQGGSLKGVAIVLHTNPYFFSFETFKLLQSLIHHSTLAFTNSLLSEELEKLVITDYLNKLYSRNYLDEKIHLSMKHDRFGTFILMDIDDFKQINDTYGHQVGDEIIILVAELIKSNIRDHDIGARWGGEELAIYLPKLDIEDGKRIAERLVKNVREKSNPEVTISCGVAHWNVWNKESMSSLFKRVDMALYLAKNSGKNQVVVDNSYIAST